MGFNLVLTTKNEGKLGSHGSYDHFHGHPSRHPLTSMNPTKKSLQKHKRQACMRRCGTPEATKASDLRVFRCFRGRCSTSQRDSTGRCGHLMKIGDPCFNLSKNMQGPPKHVGVPIKSS